MKKHLCLGALLLAGGLTTAQNGPYPRVTEWLDTTTTGIGLMPSLSSDGDLVVCGYNDGGTTGTTNIYVSLTDGRGVEWTGPIRVDNDSAAFGKLTQVDSCRVSGNNVYMMWEDKRVGLGDYNLFFNRSTDSGNSWQPVDVQLDTNYLGTGQIGDWHFTVSPDVAGDHLYVLFSADNPPAGIGAEELWFVASHDSGVTWGSPALVYGDAINGVDVDKVAMCADGNTVHLVWEDDGNSAGLDDVWYQRTTDGGATFLASRIQLDILTDPTHAGDSSASGTDGIRVLSVGNVVFAAWLEERTSSSNEEARVAISTDGGTTWAADFMVGGYDPLIDDVDALDALISGTNLMVTWVDNRVAGGGDDLVHVVTSTDTGATWSEAMVCNCIDSSVPRFCGGGTDVGVTYTADVDGAGGQYVGFAASVDGGLTWLDEVAIGDDTLYDADFAEGGYNALYRNFFSGFLSNEFSTNNVYVSGFCVNGGGGVVNRSAGTNPDSYTAGAGVIGGTIDASIDLTTTGHSFGYVAGYGGSMTFALGSGQTVLVDSLASGEWLHLTAAPGPLAQWQITVPNDPAYCGLVVYTQGAHFGTVFPWVLTNAQDITITAYE
jgi:hypothetical protein